MCLSFALSTVTPVAARYTGDNAMQIYEALENRYRRSPDIMALYRDGLLNDGAPSVRKHVIKDVTRLNAKLAGHSEESAEALSKTAWGGVWSFPEQVDWFHGDDEMGLLEEIRSELVDVNMICGTACFFRGRAYVVVYIFLEDESYNKPLRPDSPILDITLAPAEYIS